MYCERCGQRLESEERFCATCGQERSATSTIVTRHSSSKKIFVGIGIVLGIFFIFWLATPTEDLPEIDATTAVLEELSPLLEPVGELTESTFDETVRIGRDLTEDDWLNGIYYYEQSDTTQNPLTRDEEIFSAVVKIICEDDESFYYGSGTTVDPGGYILTNQHVVEDSLDGYCVVGFPDPLTGLIKEAYWGKVIIDDEQVSGHDLAYIAVTRPVVDEEGNVFGYYFRAQNSAFPYLDYYADECISVAPRLSEGIRILGYPPLSGGALTVTNGLISSLYSQSGYLITSAKIVSGNSGGLAVNEQGCHIGVPTSVYYDETENEELLGEIIDLEFVFEFDKAVRDELDEYYTANGIENASILDE